MKTLKKALSLTLALVMVLALAVPASAAGGGSDDENLPKWAEDLIAILSQRPDFGGAPRGGSDDSDEITVSFQFGSYLENRGFEMFVIAPVYGEMVSYNGEQIPVFSIEYSNIEGHRDFTVLMEAYGAYQFQLYKAVNVNGVLTNITADGTWTYTPEDTANGGMYFYCNVGSNSDEVYIVESYKNGSKMTTIGLTCAGDQPAQPTTTTPQTATPTNDKLTVNGALQSPTVYKINGNNYFKIRDLAAMLNGTEKQFDVGYDGALKSVTATTGKGYAKLKGDLAGPPAGGSQTANPSNDTIYIDGQKIDAAVYKINGNNYFKLRDLGKALNFYVGWTQADGVFIDTSKPYSK